MKRLVYACLGHPVDEVEFETEEEFIEEAWALLEEWLADNWYYENDEEWEVQ